MEAKKIINEFFHKSFVIFVLIGVINAFNGVLFGYLFSLVAQDNLGFILGYCCSLTISYLLNSHLNFKVSLSFKRYIKFWISYIPNFIIQNVFVIVFMNIMGIHKLITFATSAIISVPITYLCVKWYAMKHD